MKNQFFTGILVGVVSTLIIVGAMLATVNARENKPKDNPELVKLYNEDQADRSKPYNELDWKVIAPRDKAREKRVKELYQQNKLQTGKDYERAAMVLQHASEPDDFLLAHEFCIVAISKGNLDARWLCVASEDRFLMNINRKQRFATQYRSTPPDTKVTLYQVDEAVTDALRKEFQAPPLEEAKKREAMFNK